VGESGNGRDAIAAIRDLKPDLLFLDVQMPVLDGFGVLAAIGVERMPVVIFVTAYDRYAVRAFEVHALDYILKPVDHERFQTALTHARACIRAKDTAELGRRVLALLEKRRHEPSYVERLPIKSSDRIFFLSVEDIDWIEAADNYVRLHAGSRSHLLHETMTNLEKRLDPAQFLRVHRSRIVNVKRIKELHPLFHGEHIVVLQDGTRLSTGRSYRASMQKLLGTSSPGTGR
jgi:two-component system LytT family response regulator